MRFIKLFSFLMLFWSCENPSTALDDPLGTWMYSGTLDVGGVPLDACGTYHIAQGFTYDGVITVSDGTMTLTIYDERGTWKQEGSAVVLTPSYCRMYDDTTGTLQPVDCDSPVEYVINGDSMTNGSITMTRN